MHELKHHCGMVYHEQQCQGVLNATYAISYLIVALHMQEKVGIRPHLCGVIATDIKQKVDTEEETTDGPSTSRRPRRVTLCVEGNISAGKSTFLNWVAQGHPELDGMLEVARP